MSIKVEWYNSEQTIILQTYIGLWTVNELRAVVDKTVLMLKSVEHSVYIITDFSSNKTNLAKMLHTANYFETYLQSNYVLGIIVGLNNYLKLVVKIINGVAPNLVKTIHYADFLEEALALIENHKNDTSAKNGS